MKSSSFGELVEIFLRSSNGFVACPLFCEFFFGNVLKIQLSRCTTAVQIQNQNVRN